MTAQQTSRTFLGTTLRNREYNRNGRRTTQTPHKGERGRANARSHTHRSVSKGARQSPIWVIYSLHIVRNLKLLRRCLLADPVTGAVLLRAENSVVTSNDPTLHAELSGVSEACKTLDGPTVKVTPTVRRREGSNRFLSRKKGAVMYASTEPCSMCAGAIVWSGISTVIYGIPCTFPLPFLSSCTSREQELRQRNWAAWPEVHS